ncbi:hypothetical protein C1646_753082 [Rhizophagus diaphanus]|nr:hypothetical protein C1646_753082 [Rhizophagus diaphanus] [Rhizophagus sp. MUCL 43196]
MPNLKDKLSELDQIFKDTANEMDWNYAEQSEMLKEYTTLNKEFASRLKDENFLTYDKGLGDKRPVSESPGVEISKQKDNKKKRQKEKEIDTRIKREARKILDTKII